jgi:hypothetical protein
VNDHNTVAIANRVFEMRLYQYFIGESQRNEDLRQAAAASRSTFVAECDAAKLTADSVAGG